MTFQKLFNILTQYNIPFNVHIMSDSGWECGPTEMNGIWYNQKENLLIFTQGGAFDEYKVEGYDLDASDWQELTITDRQAEENQYVSWKAEIVTKRKNLMEF